MSTLRRLKRLLPAPLTRRLRDVRRWYRARPARVERHRERLLASPALRPEERRWLSNVDSRISANEGTYLGDGTHYFGVGLSAIRCIDAALGAAGRSDVRSVLDLPCGHGRVLRFLLQRFPDATFTACDLDADAVDFCARTFGARPAYSKPDLGAVDLGVRVDLIWCGSLATHLDAGGIAALLELFARHLAPGGVAVFTTHGDYVAQRLSAGEYDYALEADDAQAIVQAYEQSGFAYADYTFLPGYGVSLSHSTWIRDLAGRAALREVYFAPRGWDDHQDVFAFVKHE